ncbi:hypothetical protein [Rurimicrobium arvi]|uniref:PA14 domain-containing protein n=1 Tax=Rurimicrobium arvi TaxID=2049916 RepID=A0ABP8MSN5_9BACT
MKRKNALKLIAHVTILSLTYQLVFPACAYALTSGPMQPEVQSFEPVGTTEMVDVFTGDFNYNIPLIDVEGYPINIFYHSGVGIEQEASWVGLGWNINPGEINRTVRGLPDDLNGETIEKEIHIQKEKDIRIGLGVDVAIEIFGKELPDQSHETQLAVTGGGQIYVAYNNYRGLSTGVSSSLGLQSPMGSVGIGMGIGTQTGADIDASASFVTDKLMGKLPFGASFQAGVGMNSRTGVKDISLGMSTYARIELNGVSTKDPDRAVHRTSRIGVQAQKTIPVGMQNYVPVIANKMTQTGQIVQRKLGFSVTGTTISAFVSGQYVESEYETDGSRKGFGYLNMQNSSKEDMLDFTREKDGQYNKTIKNLPMPSLTYDVFSVNGQGVGGMFRAHRNDLGTVFDPYVSAYPPSEIRSGQKEVGVPGEDYGEVGDDATRITTYNMSGAWSLLPFAKRVDGSLFEPWYFKQAGELTYDQSQEVEGLFNADPYIADTTFSMFSGKGNRFFPFPGNYVFNNVTAGRALSGSSGMDRSSRATNISALTFDEIQKIPEMPVKKKTLSYSGNFPNPTLSAKPQNEIYKGSSLAYKASGSQLAQLTQTMPDGRRYVYGLPVMNNVIREVTFSADETSPSKIDLNNRYVTYDATEFSSSNPNGRDHFYSSTVTPPHAGSYMLTEVLSNDYVDILGDGPTNDDPGTFVKYNYELKNDDYRWKAPYQSNKAHYDRGFVVDTKDGKGNVVMGSRQLWHVKSIESKNYIAEFYTSPRQDAHGSMEAVLPSNSKYPSVYKSAISSYANTASYKLDSIRLFNKHDRFLNGDAAIPVKTVFFQYETGTNTLCKGLPNAESATAGKLTLKRIYIGYGNSHKNMLSPYEFTYHASNPDYNYAAKDRWGNYKPAVAGQNNFDFPYCDQDPAAKSTQDYYAASWNLTDVKLPSGGKIHVDYESDDYSSVQNKRPMSMFKIFGIGSTSSPMPLNYLYNDRDNINRFVYFKRNIGAEVTGSMRDNYFQNETYLYYSFAIDVGCNNVFDDIKGYAKIKDVGVCPGLPDYGYVELELENVNGQNIHPATRLSMNTGRYYLPQYFYDNYNISATDPAGILLALAGLIPELTNTILQKNPFKTFLNKGKSKVVALDRSFIRLQVPGLTKRGGGIRVKQLTLSDSWDKQAGGQAATYGKSYDYTMNDPTFGIVSSGVASYEPIQGGDENPFRQPVPYSAEVFKGMPSIDFFQEEPFGEGVYPPAAVGYSKVTVRSIHQNYGRSSQSYEEYGFYTARDFPIIVNYTDKNADETQNVDFGVQENDARVTQGYSVILNDMHGKPKYTRNYVVHKTASGNPLPELISGQTTKYRINNSGNLSNNVTAVVRKRGTENFYELKEVILGQDVDYTIDSRSREGSTTTKKKKYNLNVIQGATIPIPVPSYFKSSDLKSNRFYSLVTSKVIQQYGIVQSVEQTDHHAVTTTENLVYDAETGGVLLSRVNNEFNKYNYSVVHPAYMAYEGMRPAYTNDGYQEVADFSVNTNRDGFIYTKNFDRFSPGDELLVTTRRNGTFKVWVMGAGVDPLDPPGNGDVSVALVKDNKYCTFPSETAAFTIKNSSGVIKATGTVNKSVVTPGNICGADYAFNTTLLEGNYTCEVKYAGSPVTSTKSFTVVKGKCTQVKIFADCPPMGNLQVNGSLKKGGTTSENCYIDMISYPTIISVRRLNSNTANDFSSDNSANGFKPIIKFDYYFLDSRPDIVNFPLPDGYYQVNAIPIMAYVFNLVHPGKIYTSVYRVVKINGGKTLPLIFYPTTCNPIGLDTLSETTYISSPGSSGTDDGSGSSSSAPTTVKPCGIMVSPRFKDQFDASSVNVSTWPQEYKMIRNARVKVIRSGRRNNLDKTVQSTHYIDDAIDPGSLGITDLFNRKTDLLDISGNTFTDEAQMYEGFLNSASIPGDYRYEQFNPYVLGTKGTYRTAATYMPLAERSYVKTYTGTDGLFSLTTLLWNLNNGKVAATGVCDGPTDVLEPVLSLSQSWKRASLITRYDIFGNALEEKDAIDNYSSVQYGYNKSLPVAVASNVRLQQFMFEGFEDYTTLLAQTIAQLFLKGDAYSAFGLLFGDRRTDAGATFTMYNQTYYKRNLAPVFGGGMEVSSDQAHTGLYSLKTNAALNFGFDVADPGATQLARFKFAPGKKYLVQVWAKGTLAETGTGALRLKIGSGADIYLKAQTGNIDDWRLYSTTLDLSGTTAGSAVTLSGPSGIYLDDFRALPMESNMKSFVYDPVSMRLMAQLDEQNMATFFEYDQEGLLVRTKKETSRGIVTISESRRANAKK